MLERTFFYGLPLQSSGTGEVESLRGYCQRLAFAQGMKVRTLLQVAMSRMGWEGQAPSLSSMLKTWAVHGASDLGVRLVELLGRATGCDLSLSTLARFKPLLAEQHLTLSGSGRYCPLCVKEAGAHGQLLWEVACVSVCPTHGVRLRDASACAAAEEMHLTRTERPQLSHVCNTCGSIGFACRTDAPDAATEAELWTARQAARLLAIPAHTVESWNASSLIQGLRSVVDGAFSGQVVRASREAKLARGVVCMWLSGKIRPNLTGLMKLCQAANADIVEVFAGRFVLLDAHAQDETPRVVPAVVGAHRTYRRRASLEEMPTLLRAAAAEAPPPSLEAFARRHDTNKRTLVKKWPELTHVLAAAAAAHREAKWREAYERAERMYEQAALTLRESGKPITSKYLQAASGLAAFSQNPSRVRALNAVIERFSRMPPVAG